MRWERQNAAAEICHSENNQQMHLTLFFFLFLLNQKAVKPSTRGDATSKDKAGITWRLTLSEWCLSSSSHRLISRASSHNRHKGQRCCVGGCVFVCAHYVFPTNQIKTWRKEKPDTCLGGEMMNFLLFLFFPLSSMFMLLLSRLQRPERPPVESYNHYRRPPFNGPKKRLKRA